MDIKNPSFYMVDIGASYAVNCNHVFDFMNFHIKWAF